MPSDTPTMPPREPTIADVYTMQLQLAETVATILSLVRTLAGEVAVLHEAKRQPEQRIEQ